MLQWFICPDGGLTTINDCMAKCRNPDQYGNRCQTLPYLVLCAEEREWKGEPSTTQMLRGTCEAFLMLTQPYVVDPDAQAFMIHGTLSHQQLELKAKDLGMIAELSTSFDGRNAADLLENENGAMVLTDYKRWGSYRIAKAMGIVELGKKPDPSGAVYQKSGKWGKAGTPKMIPAFGIDSACIDNWETEYQLNRYTYLIEDYYDIHIDRMRVHVIARDGGLQVATSRGVTRNTYMINIPRLDKELITNYFTSKRSSLLKALDTMITPPPCSDEECWNGRKCKDYCNVWHYCVRGKEEKR